MSDVLVVVSKVKAYVAEHNLRTAGDVAEALTDHITEILDAAIPLVKEDGKQTLGASHILDVILRLKDEDEDEAEKNEDADKDEAEDEAEDEDEDEDEDEAPKKVRRRK